jgi:hypothetical protein
MSRIVRQSVRRADNTPCTMPDFVSRDEAKAKGLTRYFEGLECCHGHIAERQVSDSNCVECKNHSDRVSDKRRRENVVELTQDRLKQQLDYHTEAGCFTWKARSQGRPGKVAGFLYKGLPYNKLDGRKYLAASLAWLWAHGELPKGRIAHLNGNEADNRLANLQLVADIPPPGITQEYLKQLFHYDPDTGEFTWKMPNSPRMKAGDRAGTVYPSGQRVIGIDGQTYLEARLVWMWAHGSWPNGKLRHINGEVDDNRLANLEPLVRKVYAPKTKRERIALTPTLFWDGEHNEWRLEAGDFVERFNSYQDALAALNTFATVELTDTF